METEILDNKLLSGLISPESYKQLLDAEIYGAVTPMQWLEKRLLVVLSLINSGTPVFFDTGNANGSIKTVEEFRAWCKKHFPDTYSCFMDGKHI